MTAFKTVNSMKIKNTKEDRVVLKNVTNISKMSAGGILIPENAEIAQIGEVFKIGLECTTTQVGDRAVLEKGYGIKIEVDNEKFVIVREGDILFIAED